jgi:hypothetical protein
VVHACKREELLFTCTLPSPRYSNSVSFYGGKRRVSRCGTVKEVLYMELSDVIQSPEWGKSGSNRWGPLGSQVV